jgi:hypothetical protein
MTKVGAPTAARCWAFADSGSTVMASGRASVRSVDTTSPRMTTVMATIEAVAEKPLGQMAAFSQSLTRSERRQGRAAKWISVVRFQTHICLFQSAQRGLWK